jgi:hypothetical protein
LPMHQGLILDIMSLYVLFDDLLFTIFMRISSIFNH